MDILVIGATGGSGRAAVTALAERGHRVTALARRATSTLAAQDRVTPIDADATDPALLERIVPGHDAIIVTLGISEPPMRVRLRGARHTIGDIRSRGTRAVLAAAARAGVRRVIVQSSYGVGPTRHRLSLRDRAVFAVMLRPQIDDTERQEQIVRASGLDWTIVQPVYLSDDADGEHHVTRDGSTRRTRVSRRAVGIVHAELVESGTSLRETITVSG